MRACRLPVTSPRQVKYLVVVLAIGESSPQAELQRLWLRAAGYHADARAHGWPAAGERHGETRIDAVCASGDSPEEGVDLTALSTSKLGIPTSCYVYYTLYENCASVGETAVKNCGHGGKCYDEDVRSVAG